MAAPGKSQIEWLLKLREGRLESPLVKVKSRFLLCLGLKRGSSAVRLFIPRDFLCFILKMFTNSSTTASLL